MTESILAALREVRSRLQPYFPDPLPPEFGYSTVWMLQERLRAEGIEATGLVEEILLQGCDSMIKYLQKGGSAGRPESLFQGSCCHVLEGLLGDSRRSQAAELMRLLDGDIGLESCSLDRNSMVLAEIRRAVDRLPHPFRTFLTCDFIEALPEEDMRVRFSLADHEEYLQLKRLSLVALRREIERSFNDQ
jgi:hypothetical protein